MVRWFMSTFSGAVKWCMKRIPFLAVAGVLIWSEVAHGFVADQPHDHSDQIPEFHPIPVVAALSASAGNAISLTDVKVPLRFTSS
jgi:hypothetical protein